MNWLQRFFLLARSKVTTYLALAIAGISQLADHAENLVGMAPSLAPYLPKAPLIASVMHWLVTGLGILVVFTRIRRELKA